MAVGYESCGGLDVHAKTVVACLVTKGRKEIRTFATMTDELLQWGEWPSSGGGTPVAIESRGGTGSRCVQPARKPVDRPLRQRAP